MYYTSARITHAYIYTSRMCIVYMLANLDNYYTHSLHAVRFAAPPIKPRQNALPVSPSILSILLLRFVFIDFCKLVFLSFFLCSYSARLFSFEILHAIVIFFSQFTEQSSLKQCAFRFDPMHQTNYCSVCFICAFSFLCFSIYFFLESRHCVEQM